jgi:hypothetical protein
VGEILLELKKAQFESLFSITLKLSGHFDADKLKVVFVFLLFRYKEN